MTWFYYKVMSFLQAQEWGLMILDGKFVCDVQSATDSLEVDFCRGRITGEPGENPHRKHR